MAKSYSISCIYHASGTCNHHGKPHGSRPSPGVCAKACKHYTGEHATAVDRPAPVAFTQGAKPKQATGNCSACGDGAKKRVKPVKRDPAEAMRILNEAMNQGGA
jgi:hypothetical protein